MLSDVRVEGVASVGGRGRVASILEIQNLYFFVKENWICVMARYYF